ncbi:hypothetical protein B0H66DRAFT_555865 [Apodospora peruviana]|uniref:Uncharacterized protein n=1 Tax=Apodospora peruviana TaxID=516989 RepID=A0AAE0M4V4_9PEZI|nr:hypothetical protein B0H66DRAFT_555865 [Apodospora peruviana]
MIRQLIASRERRGMVLLPLNLRVPRSLLIIFFAFSLSFVLFYGYSISSNSPFFESESSASFSNAITTIITAAPTTTPSPIPIQHTATAAPVALKPTTSPGPPINRRPPSTHAPPKYKPSPVYAPPPVTDPFPLLATSTASPPPIPAYNVPRPDMHKEYGIDRPPPLYIGFTRQWPMLLQAVVSYITAGWPAEGIFVVENTGVHNSNRDGLLSIQNPFYLNHTTLHRLGVNVVQTPVLLNFAQLQNFFLHQAIDGDYPQYFYSHQDVVVFSFEDGPEDVRRKGDRDWQFYDEDDKREAMFPAAAGEPGYRTIYENCLRELRDTLARGERWGMRWFQYDHLTLVNREAFVAVGAYDAMIPYYHSDCDMNAKLEMDGWTTKFRRVGIINDISSVMTDLGAFYRLPHIVPNFTDPNPLPLERENKIKEDKEKAEKKKAEKEEQEKKAKEEAEKKAKEAKEAATAAKKAVEEEKAANTTTTFIASEHDRRDDSNTPPEGMSVAGEMPSDPIAYFRVLNQVGLQMNYHKYRDGYRARNTWQVAQRGGFGEPFYYDGAGFGEAFEVLTGAGREVFARKWGTRQCNLVKATALNLDDAWRVEKDG